jgi:4-hydroxy-3-methylbut-2-en-1-yl diphosphate reductase
VTAARSFVLLRPRGFCAGVVRAIDAVRAALERYGPPVYVRHEIVHNEHVIRELEAAGAVFVDELEQVPAGARVMFSAHGVAPSVRDDARRLGLDPIDATCPLVTKVHLQAIRLDRRGFTILLIGHPGHVEVAGTRGEAPGATQVVASVADAEAVVVADPERVAYLTQTTLSMDDVADIVAVLVRRFPKIQPPERDDICYATANRQSAVRAMADRLDLVLVVGSRTSSNSRSLVETARRSGVEAALVPDPSSLPWSLLGDARRVGVTSGASTPESLLQQVVQRLARAGFRDEPGIAIVTEDVHFSLPPGLRDRPNRNLKPA